MELRQLRQFVALAETQNFHRASEVLNMAQPPLSVSIRKLEDDLGVRLVERHARGVTLTPEGELAAQQAREILRLADELKQTAAEAVVGARGPLALGFVASATYDIIPNLVPVFRERYPSVELGLREATSAVIIQSLINGDLDAGLVRTPLFGVSGIELIHLAVENMVLAVPRGHPLESRTEVELRELGAEPTIAWNKTAEPWIRTLLDLSFSAVGLSPNVIEEASQIHTMVALVECGIGVAIVPAVLRRAGLGRVRLVDLVCKGAPIEIGFAVAVRAGPARRLTANFANVAVEVLRNPDFQASAMLAAPG